MPLDLKEQRAFNCSYLDEISIKGLFLRSSVPVYQKSIANNFVIIRKIFSYTIVQPKVTSVEYRKLKEFGLLPLELTGEEKMYSELMRLLNEPAEEIFAIRVKELKYILANTSKAKLQELNGGYKVLIKYLEFIGN